MTTSRHPFSSRLSFFTGKGGVGKSTLVASLAIEAARRGMRPLVVELGHRATMQGIFGVDEIAHTPTEVAPGVFATNIDLDEALTSYVAEHVPVAALAKRIAKSQSLRRFFEAAPAVGEILTLQRLEQLLGGPWSPILVDLDATGHALMFLELPKVFEGLVPEGPIRRLLDSFAALLRDGELSQLHLVTLPYRLPVQETLELHERLRAEHAIRLGTLFVNRVPPSPLGDEAREVLRASETDDAGAREDLELLEDACERADEARREIARLDAIAMPRVLVEARRAGTLDRAALSEMGARLAETWG